MEASALDVCSNCGEFVEKLNPVSGWCYSCSPPTCYNCNEVFDSYGQHRDLCPRCRRTLWDIEHADAIERFMADGLTLTKAREAVKRDARPVCLCCCEPILHGNPNRDRFCNKYEKCRQSARRYKYYVRDRKMPPDLALIEVVQTLTRETAV